MKQSVYKGMNIIAVVLSGVWFVAQMSSMKLILAHTSYLTIIITVCAAIAVHILKLCRLYFILYGNDAKLLPYLENYFITATVSIAFPIKTGEFFRMYCYGNQIGSALKGIIVILLDRFMDTAALLTMIVLIWIWNAGNITAFAYFLAIFLITSLLLFLVFPGIHQFWKRYLLCAKATEHRLQCLKVLEILHALYCTIETAVKGRGIILYLLSFIAWGIEIGNIAATNTIAMQSDASSMTSAYLRSVLGSEQTEEFRLFNFICVAALALAYVIVHFVRTRRQKERGSRESNSVV